MKKFICILICIIFALNAAGCSGNVLPPQENTPVPSPDGSTSAPTEVPTQADIEFEEIDREIFLSIVTSDGLTYHQLIVDPEAFDIDEADIERGWGDISYESAAEGCEADREMLERLKAIDKNELSEMNKLAYDNIYECFSLATETGEDYYYYSEPLTTLNGEHTTVPLMLMLYEINKAEDVENYLYLLDDAVNYLEQIEQFEREKAEHGLFMSENALDQVIASCREFASQGEKCFLLDHFEEVLDKTELGFSKSEKDAYKKRNREIILEKLLPEYEKLTDTLESLRGKCGKFAGAAARGEEAKKYFCSALKSAAACNIGYGETANILRQMCQQTYAKLNSLIIRNLAHLDEWDNPVTTGSVPEDIEYLKSLMESVYPGIPEQNLNYIDVPMAIAEDFSPAAYLISAFDDPSRNVILMNPTSKDADMLFTLAHECFPGHLYQTQYFRNMEGLSLTQQAIAPTGYLEGWAVFSENFMPGMFKEYGTGICRIKQLNSVLANVLIPAYVSLQVNAFNWSKDDIKGYIKNFGLDNMDYVNLLYEYSVNMPLYFFNYAMGYTYTTMIYESVNPQKKAEKLKFFTEYLNYGPCYYDILFEKFNIEPQI